jgi:hypothetical protein
MEVRAGEWRHSGGGKNLMVSESFDQKVSPRMQGANHRNDLREDQREVNGLLVLLVSPLLHPAIATEEMNSLLRRWQGGVNCLTKRVDVRRIKNISRGVSSVNDCEEPLRRRRKGQWRKTRCEGRGERCDNGNIGRVMVVNEIPIA